jgi:hypothetical protein
MNSLGVTKAAPHARKPASVSFRGTFGQHNAPRLGQICGEGVQRWYAYGHARQAQAREHRRCRYALAQSSGARVAWRADIRRGEIEVLELELRERCKNAWCAHDMRCRAWRHAAKAEALQTQQDAQRERARQRQHACLSANLHADEIWRSVQHLGHGIAAHGAEVEQAKATVALDMVLYNGCVRALWQLRKHAVKLRPLAVRQRQGAVGDGDQQANVLCLKQLACGFGLAWGSLEEALAPGAEAGAEEVGKLRTASRAHARRGQAQQGKRNNEQAMEGAMASGGSRRVQPCGSGTSLLSETPGVRTLMISRSACAFAWLVLSNEH